MRIRLIALSLPLWAALLPHSMRAQTAAAPCAEVAADTSRFGTQPVYRECSVSKPVRTRKVVEPKFAAPSGISCLAATLEIVIDEKGNARLSSARVIDTNSDAFAKLLVTSLEKWRFEPAELDKRKVAQLLVLDHTLRAQDAMGRTAYLVGPDGRSGQPVRPMVSGKGPTCDP